MREIRALAARHGRQDEIGFGMRLQIACRETEAEAWEAAHELVRDTTEAQAQFIRTRYAGSVAKQRVQELARPHGELIAPHPWTGITRVRPGAGGRKSAGWGKRVSVRAALGGARLFSKKTNITTND